MPKGATVQTSKAAVGYQYCSRLFALEKKCTDFNNKLRKEYRQNYVRPVLEEYFCWVNTLNPEEGSKLETAMKYAQNQRWPLSAFIDHPDVPISNTIWRRTPSGPLPWVERISSSAIPQRAQKPVPLFTRSWKLQRQTGSIRTTTCCMCCRCCLTTANCCPTSCWKPRCPGSMRCRADTATQQKSPRNKHNRQRRGPL